MIRPGCLAVLRIDDQDGGSDAGLKDPALCTAISLKAFTAMLEVDGKTADKRCRPLGKTARLQ